MTVNLRIALIACALVAFLAIVGRLKKSQIQVLDSLFWLLFALSFVVLALFPQIAYFFSGLLGFEAPSNCVFLYVIAVLVVRNFTLTIKITGLQRKITTLVQEIALTDISKRV